MKPSAAALEIFSVRRWSSGSEERSLLRRGRSVRKKNSGTRKAHTCAAIARQKASLSCFAPPWDRFRAETKSGRCFRMAHPACSGSAAVPESDLKFPCQASLIFCSCSPVCFDTGLPVFHAPFKFCAFLPDLCFILFSCSEEKNLFSVMLGDSAALSAVASRFILLSCFLMPARCCALKGLGGGWGGVARVAEVHAGWTVLGLVRGPADRKWRKDK